MLFLSSVSGWGLGVDSLSVIITANFFPSFRYQLASRPWVRSHPVSYCICRFSAISVFMFCDFLLKLDGVFLFVLKNTVRDIRVFEIVNECCLNLKVCCLYRKFSEKRSNIS